MLSIQTYRQTAEDDYKFSILIPSWNNLEFLQLCIRSIRENSAFRHQIIVFANEGTDGTTDWLKAQKDVDFLQADRNYGICYTLNISRSLAKTDWLLYLNDDMYVCPDWDRELDRELKNIGHDFCYLSGTMIEAASSDPCVITKNYGSTINTFEEEKLLKEFRDLPKKDWQGATWPPSLVSTRLWDLVGGLSPEYSPGMYSDPDFSKKLWDLGVREFKGVAASRVYHFSTVSTGRVKQNRGSDTFLMKWGMSAGTFINLYLRRGQDYAGLLPDRPVISASRRWRNTFKRMAKSFTHNYLNSFFDNLK